MTLIIKKEIIEFNNAEIEEFVVELIAYDFETKSGTGNIFEYERFETVEETTNFILQITDKYNLQDIRLQSSTREKDISASLSCMNITSSWVMGADHG
jgi:hypothetical protein